MTPQRQQRIYDVLSKRQNDLTVVLENVFDPRNIAAIMRSCDSVGVQEIYVLNTKQPKHEDWGFRSSRSANKWLTVHQFDNLDTCISAIKEKYDIILTTHLTSDSESLYNTSFTGKTAIVFGNEQHGISEELLQKGNKNFVIPQMGMIQSLNISVACAVTLYEAYRQKVLAGHYSEQKLSAAEYNALSQQWMQKDETF